MSKSLFLLVLMLLFPSALLAQEGASAPPTEAPKGAEAAEPTEATPEAVEAKVEALPAEEAAALPVNPLAREQLSIKVPHGWKLLKVVDDDRASAFLVEGAPALTELYVFHLDLKSTQKEQDKYRKQLVSTFLNIEKQSDLNRKGRSLLRLDGCEAQGSSFEEDDMRVQVYYCTGKGKLYFWRMMMEPDQKEEHGELGKVFQDWIVGGVTILAEDGLPASRPVIAPEPSTGLPTAVP